MAQGQPKIFLRRLRLCRCLTLVVMEYGLGHVTILKSSKKFCLNPCCNGIWFRTWQDYTKAEAQLVLILVVMEYGLGPSRSSASSNLRGLNPCCNGIWSQTKLVGMKTANQPQS